MVNLYFPRPLFWADTIQNEYPREGTSVFWKMGLISLFIFVVAAIFNDPVQAFCLSNGARLLSSSGSGDINLSIGSFPESDTGAQYTYPQYTYPVSDGSDGVFHPLEDQMLTPDSDGLFNFSSIYVPAGVTVDLVRNDYEGPIYFLAREEIIIEGLIRSMYGTLVLGTEGDVFLAESGNIESPNSLAIIGSTIILGGNFPVGNTTIDPQPGEQILLQPDELIVPEPLLFDVLVVPQPVPLPGAIWLFGTGFGFLVWGRQRRQKFIAAKA